MVAVAKAAIKAVPALLTNPTTAGLARGAVIVVGIAGACSAKGGRLGSPAQIVHPAVFPAEHLGRAQGVQTPRSAGTYGRDVCWVPLGPSWLLINDPCAIATDTSQALPC